MIETIESKELRKLDAVLGGKAGVYYKYAKSTVLLVSNEVVDAVDWRGFSPQVYCDSCGMKNGVVLWTEPPIATNMPFEVISAVQQYQRYWFNVHDILDGGMYSFYVRGMDLDLTRVVREQAAMGYYATLVTSKMFNTEGVFLIEDDLLRHFSYEKMPFGGDLGPSWGSNLLYTYAQKMSIAGGRGCYVYSSDKIREGRKVICTALEGATIKLLDEIKQETIAIVSLLGL